MSGFLDEMARSSAQRVAQAARREDARCARAPRAADAAGAAAALVGGGIRRHCGTQAAIPRRGRAARLGPRLAWARRGIRARRCGRGLGAHRAVAFRRFAASILREAAAVLAPLGVPAMRKDFIVDPYQVLEARAAGAGGVLIILRMLPRARIAEMLEVAADHGLFVLLEAFDAADLELAGDLLEARRRPSAALRAAAAAPPMLLVGVNCRDLQSLGGRAGAVRATGLATCRDAGRPWPKAV